MFKLKRYLKNYIKETIIAPLFKFLESAFELLVPIIMSLIIDKGIANGDFRYVLIMAGVMLLFGVLGFTCAMIAQYYSAVAAMGFGAEVRGALYKKINSLPYKSLDKVGTSTLITRLTEDVNLAQTGINRFLRLFLRAPFIVIGALIGSLIINVKLGFIFMGVTAVLGVVILIILKLTVPKNKDIQSNLDESTLLTKENLEGARVIRAFSKQDAENEKFKKAQARLLKIQLFVSKISAILNPFSFVCANVAIVFVLLVGSKFVYNGQMTQGNVAALVNYMTQILYALIAFADLIIIISQGAAANERIKEVLDLEVPVEEPESEISKTQRTIDTLNYVPRVEFNKVSFAYNEGGENVLKDISFSAERGEIIGIIGGTGSGKTTLINLMPRFYEVTQGEILIDGRPIKEYHTDALRDKFAIVPQKSALFKGSIRDNVKWGKEDATDEEIYRALNVSQAKEFVDNFDEGLDRMIEQGGRNLSGGQKQRLAIARAVVKNPQILILDDSASALDYATEKAVRRGIRTLTGCTIFIISQRAASIMDADKIIVLDDGEIAGIGKHKELYKTCSVYKEICDTQFSEKEED